jgi:hypothetical protein
MGYWNPLKVPRAHSTLSAIDREVMSPPFFPSFVEVINELKLIGFGLGLREVAKTFALKILGGV